MKKIYVCYECFYDTTVIFFVTDNKEKAERWIKRNPRVRNIDLVPYKRKKK